MIFQEPVISNFPVKYKRTSCQPYLAFGMAEITYGSLKLDMKF